MWLSNDITWCTHAECPVTNCRRHQSRKPNKAGVSSFADFRMTSECPVDAGLAECVDGCYHAKECFEETRDPNEALQKLTDTYCDHCLFSTLEED